MYNEPEPIIAVDEIIPVVEAIWSYELVATLRIFTMSSKTTFPIDATIY